MAIKRILKINNSVHELFIAFENTVRKGEIAYKTSNFSFSHNVFYPTWHLFFILNTLLNVVGNLFQFGPV